MKFIDAVLKFKHLLPGCPEQEAADALRFAVIEFCEKSLTITRWVDKTSAVLTFDTTGEAATQVVGLFDAYVNGVQAAVSHMNSGALDSATTDEPVITHTEDLNTSIAISPTPASVVPVRLLVAFAPTPDANEFPDHLWMMRREALKAGALARLLSEPGTTYVNEQRAAGYRQQFDEAIDSASIAASVNRATTSRRLKVAPAN